MNLVSSSFTSRAGKVAQLALATLVLAVGCDKDSGTDTSEGSSTDTPDPTATGTGTTEEEPQPGTESTGDPEPTGGDTTDEPAAVSYTLDIQPIWDMRCVTGCHVEGGSGFLSSDLLLTPESSYAQLVNVMSVGAPGLVRIAPGDPDGSYVWHKLNNTQVDVNGGGSQMPVGGLPTDQIAKIEQWINEGAQP